MENNNDNPQPEKKSNFWAQFFPKESESQSDVRYRITELLTENINLKKQIAKLNEENKVLHNEVRSAKKRASSYAGIIEHQKEQINTFKERFE